MATERQIQGSRKNARGAVGPRSATGKALSPADVRRHGRSVPIWSDLKLAAKATALGHAISGPERVCQVDRGLTAGGIDTLR